MHTIQECSVSAASLRDAIKMCCKYSKNNCVQLELAEGSVTVSATNFEQFIVNKVNANCNQTGKIVVSGGPLAGVLATMDNVTLTINYSESGELVDSSRPISLSVECDGGSIEFQAEDNYLPVLTIPEVFHEADSSFVSNLRRAIKCSDQDNHRYALGCVMIDDGNMIATDGRRLVRLDCQKFEQSFMIPIECCKFAVSQFIGAGIAYDTEQSKGLFWIREGEVMMASRIVEGRYPNWRQVIPSADSMTDSMTVKTNALLLALNRLAPLVDSEERGVAIDVKNGKASLSVKRAGKKGSASFAQDGELKVTLDLNYLKDMLDLHKEDAMIIKSRVEDGKQTGPVLLDLGFDYVVMPMARS